MTAGTEKKVAAGPRRQPSDRLVALDWMRGIVMVLMAIDHAGVFDAGHLANDSWALHDPDSALPLANFLTRWITHICAPTFLFLAGTALALSISRRTASGMTDRAINLDLLKRALVLLAFELLFWGPLTLQVLYAIALSFIAMIFLRHWSNRALLILAFIIIGGNEALAGLAMHLTGHEPAALMASFKAWWTAGEVVSSPLPVWFAAVMLLLHPGVLTAIGPVAVQVLYPVLPWLAMMLPGWVFGRYLIQYRKQPSRWTPERVLLVGGALALGVFVVIRGLNSYGNMFLLRADGSLIQWLFVSKYPPSIAYTALELGLMALGLWGCFRVQKAIGDVWRNNPLLVFGQTALFFYLLHMPLMIMIAAGLGVMEQLGLEAVYPAALGIMVLLYPLCRWFRRYKAARPGSWVRLL